MLDPRSWMLDSMNIQYQESRIQHPIFFGSGLSGLGEREDILMAKKPTYEELEERIKGLEQEIVERKQTEKTLEISERKYRAIVENAPDMIYILDPKGHFSYVAGAFETLLGFTAKELIGYHFTSIVWPEDVKKAQYHFNERRTWKRSTKGFEVRLTTRRGTGKHFDIKYLPVELYAFGIYDKPVSAKDKRFLGTYGVARDITDRKQAEDKLKEYSERLEEMVKDRTKELQEAQEYLVRRERLTVLGQLAGGVAHELRGPQAAIKNAVYFLNTVLEKPEPDIKETLEILDREVETSSRIISCLLDLARPKLLVRQQVDIADIVKDVLSRTQVPHDVEVVTQLDDSLPTILADPDQLFQVFGNIIRNAIQAMPKGGQLVIEGYSPHADWVAITFTDTGLGIPANDLEKVFESLFTTKAKGLGLGLPHTKILVEAHGGAIDVQSQVGKGTTFTVRLPVKD